jgi:20S proteasome alpha/beta subunit
MSFIIAVYTNEGIVLAGDRRTTFVEKKNQGSTKVELIGTHVSNSAEKTFLCPNGVGISMCGEASWEGNC